MKKSTRKISLQPNDKLTLFFNENEGNKALLKEIEKQFSITIRLNAVGILVVKGAKGTSEKIFNTLMALNKSKKNLSVEDVRDFVLNEKTPDEIDESQLGDWNKIQLNHGRSGKSTTIKTLTQRQDDFVQAILNKKVTLGMGSPGTGKSYIAVAVALKLLELKKIDKIILCKPAIESGPSIGFLPGDVEQKLAQFVASLMSILTELIGAEKRDKLISQRVIEIENIGFLRGLTIGAESRNGVACIIDEAQNIEFAQHKMILTRLGNHPESRMILCGDQKQSDLRHKKDTLSLIHKIIKDSPFVGTVVFQKEDVVRSEVTKDLLGRIETWEDEEAEKNHKRA